jgi:hypothetical protein
MEAAGGRGRDNLPLVDLWKDIINGGLSELRATRGGRSVQTRSEYTATVYWMTAMRWTAAARASEVAGSTRPQAGTGRRPVCSKSVDDLWAAELQHPCEIDLEHFRNRGDELKIIVVLAGHGLHLNAGHAHRWPGVRGLMCGKRQTRRAADENIEICSSIHFAGHSAPRLRCARSCSRHSD